jgi:aspartyl-tRNA(Asn)/glutamyl-tRNA(Gln) amidotransferase subunit A
MDTTSANVPVPDYTAALTGDLKGARLGLPRALFGKGLDDDIKKLC